MMVKVGVKTGLTKAEKIRQGVIFARLQKWGTYENAYADSGLWEWLTHVKTKDEHDHNNPVKKFPIGEKDYITFVMLCFLMGFDPEREDISHMLGIRKSRQILITWCEVVFLAWVAWRRPYSEILFQTKKESDALGAISKGREDPDGGRMAFVIRNLPTWLGDPAVARGDGNKRGELIGLNSSRVIAAPQGADQVASHTATGFCSDEAALQEEFEGAYYKILPAVHGGGFFLMASTAQQSFYWRITERGADEDQSENPFAELLDRVNIPKGMDFYMSKYGFPVLTIHYSADPDKDPATESGKAWVQRISKRYPLGMADQGWQREMEMNAEVGDSEPVFPQLADPLCPIFRPVPTDADIEAMQLYAGFDLGTRNPSAWVVVGVDKQNRLWFIHEVYKPCKNYRELVAEIKGWKYYDRVKYTIADPSILNQATHPGLDGANHTWGEYFAGVDFDLVPGRRGQDYAVSVKLRSEYWSNPTDIRAFITDGCPKGQWESRLLMYKKLSEKAAIHRNQPEEIMDKNNHWFDAAALVLDSLPEFKVQQEKKDTWLTWDYWAGLIKDRERENGIREGRAGACC
ncbi:MAG: hypothetical protein WC120_05345 [Parcubacteria group bacterium]